MEPVILAEKVETGQTIIEGLEEFPRECEFAVILLTADDVTDDGDYRARQNVIHECGFFQGLLGRKKVILVAQKGVQVPSNLDGLYKLEFSKDSEETYSDLKNILEKRDASVYAQEIKTNNSQDDRFFVPYKKDFYDLLKKNKFARIGDDFHKRTYEHIDGEKLDLVIDMECEFNEKTKNKEYFFRFKREYIYFNKKNRETYKKDTKTYEFKIPVKSTYNEKRNDLEDEMERMEEHSNTSESEIKLKCKKDGFKYNKLPVLIIIISLTILAIATTIIVILFK